MIEPTHVDLSVGQQCQLLHLPRSSYYYEPRPCDEKTLELLHLIDEEYTRHPFLGTRRMTAYLKTIGYEVNRKRIKNLYRTLDIQAIYPKPNTSKAAHAHKIYPYLLRDLPVIKANQVFCADISYLRMQQGFMYLFAIMDWYSRYVLGWCISPTLEAEFCTELLRDVLSKQICEIFNTDQGSQFTSAQFTEVIKNNGIKISMDGRGRAFDNIFIERLWRSVKYECIYLHSFTSVDQLHTKLEEYFDYYNNARLHQALTCICASLSLCQGRCRSQARGGFASLDKTTLRTVG